MIGSERTSPTVNVIPMPYALFALSLSDPEYICSHLDTPDTSVVLSDIDDSTTFLCRISIKTASTFSQLPDKMSACSPTSDIDQLAALIAKLSLSSPEDVDLIERFEKPTPAQRNPAAQLNAMAPEIILNIFYQLSDSAESRLGDVLSLAMTSNKLYCCFKDSEFALFRRVINKLLSSGPAFCDYVLKIGSLHSTRPWPTNPDDIESALFKLGCTEVIFGEHFVTNFREREKVPAREIGNIVTPSMYADILTWVRSEIPLAMKPDKDALPRYSCGPNGHPYKYLYIREPSSDAERLVHYQDQMIYQVWKYRQHFEKPWTEAEDRLYGSDTYIPCCGMKDDCPRIPMARISKQASPINRWAIVSKELVDVFVFGSSGAM
ncbi:hypothetical protein CONLIGDRAFT_698541 [Coniochaeta ligniaria NRRL 30616]|uniref:Uncharacterized protein n=1 Tax=Coniochaeta ligniaria NRRL 30616 TaxID=1408157 RepID=A0A1J7IXK6_9PEZI|nr:hypothetical protein CONLIGDRAFT_698541 [Coniochaeta ligniaria NRRL 30616]